MEERIVVSEITGRRFKAVPNATQVLLRGNSCDGCAFFKGRKANCVPSNVEREYGDESALRCGGCKEPVDQQIIWMDIDENGNHIDNSGEVEVPQEG